MIVEGQIHGGLTDGVGMALMELIAFDEDGNCLGASLMDYLIPTAVEVPDWETDYTVTPSPHHPIGAKGIGESATVGSPPAIVNAICDALPSACATSTCRAPRPGCGTRCGKGGQRDDQGRARRRRWSGCAPSGCRSSPRPSCARPSRPACGRATRRSCSPTARSTGFVGGVCAQASVRLHAARVLETGEAVLLRLVPGRRATTTVAGRRGRRAQPVPERRRRWRSSSTRISPAPRVLIVRDTPIARALEERRARRGLRRLARRRVDPQPSDAALVVASHGDDEEVALARGAARRASATSALVASTPRGAAVLRVARRRRTRCARSSTRPPASTSARARRATSRSRSSPRSSPSARRTRRRPPAPRSRRDRPGLRDAGRGQRRLGAPRPRRRALLLLLRGLPRPFAAEHAAAR